MVFKFFFLSIQQAFHIKRSNHTLNCVSLKDILNHFNRVNSTVFATCKQTQIESKITFFLFLLILCS